ncbi:MAG TPA: hypothetical protein VNQ73_20515 [Ilumatobacter sp.]|nr:hypothetical protein [Ilumatobacter sp.]
MLLATALTATTVAVVAPVGPAAAVLAPANPATQTNRDLIPQCGGLKITVIIDESSSISNTGNPSQSDQVRNAVRAFANSLTGVGAYMRVIEFGVIGRDVDFVNASNVSIGNQFLPIDTLVAGGNSSPLNRYLTAVVSGENRSYQPGNNNTNWESALWRATQGEGPGDLVVFVTDGAPNTYGTSSGTLGGGGNASDVHPEAWRRAVTQARVVQQTAHIVGVGVGNASNEYQFGSIASMIEGSGTANVNDYGLVDVYAPGITLPTDNRNRNRYNGTQTNSNNYQNGPNSYYRYNSQGTLNLASVDAINVGSNFAALEAALESIANALCQPSITIKKVNDANEIVTGHPFAGQVDLITPPNTTTYQWLSPNESSPRPATGETPVTVPTDINGLARFQWVPGSVASPQFNNSTFTFTETLQPGWIIDPTQSACTYSTGGDAARLTWTQTGSTVNFSVTHPTTSALFQITPGDHIECTVRNLRLPKLTVTKDAVPNHAQDFTFTASGGAISPTSFTLDDDDDATLSNQQAFTVVPGSYTITETNIPADWTLTGVTCAGPGFVPGDLTGSGNARTIVLNYGDDIICTFTNTGQAYLRLVKDWAPGADDGDTAQLAATGGVGGATIGGESALSTAPNSTTSDTITIPINSPVAFSEVLSAPANYTAAYECDNGTLSGQATYGANLTADAGDVGQTITCTFTNTRIAPDVSVSKAVTAGPTVQAGTNLYDIEYTITVRNNSPASGTFQLGDVLTLPAGTATIGTITTSPGSVVLTPGWNGSGALAPSQPIGGNATITITIPVTVALPGTTVLGADCDASQDPGRVVLNAVSLVGSTTDDPADNTTCTPLPDPDISHEKVLTSATRGADGLWTIVYDVVVTNDGDGPGVYSLVDEFNFGGGVTVSDTPTVTVASTGQTQPLPPTSANLGFNGTTDTTLIEGQQIVAGATHTYTITVTATVADPTPAPGAGACSDAEQPTAGGFLNVATLTTPGQPDTSDDACAPFGTLTLNKVVQGGPASTDDFTLTATGAAGASPATFSGVSGVSHDVVPEIEYTLSESFTVDGYAQSGDWVCVGATVTDGNKVTVPNGGDVTCTVTNVYTPPNVSVRKHVVDGPTQVPGTNRYNVTYLVTVTNGSTTAGTFDLTDALTFPAGSGSALYDVGTLTATGIAAGDLNQAWNGSGNLLVDGATPHPIAGNSTATITVPVTVTLPGADASGGACADDDGRVRSVLNHVVLAGATADADDSTCTELPDPNPTITKVAGEPVYDADTGEWTITYTIEVANTGTPGPGPGAYHLDDELDVGAGVNITDVTAALASAGGQTAPAVPATNGDFDGVVNTRIASNVTIVGGVTHTYTVTVTFTIDADEVQPPAGDDPGSLECGATDNNPNGTPGQATYNLAEITHPVTDNPIDDDDACQPLPLAEVTKAGPAAATWVSGTTYQATYTVTATNIGGEPVAVTVTDTPSIGIAGAAITGVSVGGNPVVGYADGDTIDLVAGAVLSDPAQLTPPIAIGDNIEYTVVVTFTVPAGTPDDDRQCAADGEPDQGLHNGAEITFEGGTDDDAVCTNIPNPNVEVDKHHDGAPAVTWDAAGELTAVYYIDVTNLPDGAPVGVGAYTLTDQFGFPSWVTVTGVSVASTNGAALDPVVFETGAGSNDQTVTLSTADTVIEPGATHTYAVTITFTADGTATDDGAACLPGSPGNGLFNIASVGAAAGQSDDDCVDIPRAHLVVHKTTIGGDATFTFVAPVTLYRSDTEAAASTITTSGGVGQWTLGAWVTPGTYSVTETLSGDWVQVDPIPATSQTAAPNSPAVWAFVNALRGPLGLTKQVNGEVTHVGGTTYTVGYELVLTTGSAVTEPFTLTDTLQFGTGTTVTGVAVTEVPADSDAPTPSADWNGGVAGLPGTSDDPDTTLATGSIAPGQTFTYHVVVTFTVDGTLTSSSADCVLGTEPGSGTFNTATVTFDGGFDDDDACAPIPNFSITKVAREDTATHVAGSTYAVTYDVAVTNNGGATATYSATDVPDFGTGATITVVEVDGTEIAGYGAGDTIDLIAQVTLDGAAATASLAAGATATYVVTVTFDVAATMPSGDRTCDPAPGTPGDATYNSATVSWNGPDRSATDCADIPAPNITTDKATAGPPVLVGNDGGVFTYTQSYTVTVSNTGQGPGTYDLVDTPNFGAGATIIAIEFGPAGADPLTELDPLATPFTIVNDAVTEPGQTDTYTVQVTFTVAADMTPAERVCADGSLLNGQGTFNHVLVTPNIGEPDTGEACQPIPGPGITVAKDAPESAEHLDGYDYSATYTVRVTNTGDGPGMYDLLEHPGFAAGATITDVVYDGTSYYDPDNDSFPVTILTDVAIGAAEQHSYEITVLFTLDPATPAVERECDSEVGSGRGGFNQVSVDVDGAQVPPADDCVDLPDPAITITKDVRTLPAQPVHVSGATFRVTYDVVVTNHGDGPGTYTATDTPAFGPGLTITDIAVDGTSVGTTVPIALGSGNLAAGASTSYVVTVTFTIGTTTTPATHECGVGSEGAGTGLFNSATVDPNIGPDVTDDDCANVPTFDVGIVKTHTTVPSGAASVAIGESFTYTLTVTNHGTGVAANVTVTDPVPARLQVTGVAVPSGWADQSSGNQVRALISTLAPGASAQIVVTVTVLADVDAAAPIDSITNTACVTAALDSIPSNNCDDDTVVIDDIVATVTAVCRNEAAYLAYEVNTSASLAGKQITMTWAPAAAATPANVVLNPQPGTPGEVLWPGVGLTPNGIARDWPGWRPLVEADYNANGTLKETDPAKLSNGMIFDGTVPDAAWAGASTVTFSVNPAVSIPVAYPSPAGCPADRDTELTIDKSVTNGSTFNVGEQVEYDLAVVNVSTVGAATSVVLTDVIPAAQRVDSITTSSSAFPRWRGCSVSGADSAGYGGVLTCTLFGVLAPGAAAPVVSLTVTINPATTLTSITNIGAVQWALFDDPSDTGEASDPATITVTGQQQQPPVPIPPPVAPPGGLPSAGSSLLGRVMPLGAGLIGLGLVALFTGRRRKQLAQPS